MGTIASALCTLSPGRKPPAVRGAASPPAPSSPRLPGRSGQEATKRLLFRSQRAVGATPAPLLAFLLQRGRRGCGGALRLSGCRRAVEMDHCAGGAGAGGAALCSRGA